MPKKTKALGSELDDRLGPALLGVIERIIAEMGRNNTNWGIKGVVDAPHPSAERHDTETSNPSFSEIFYTEFREGDFFHGDAWIPLGGRFIHLWWIA